MKNTIRPILVSIGIVLLAMVIPWGIIYPLKDQMNTYVFLFLKYSLSFIIGLVIILAIYHKYPYVLTKGKFFKNMFTFGLLGMICPFGALLFSHEKIDANPETISIIFFILYVIMVAISEELIFRCLILNIFLQAWKNKTSFVLKSVLACSVIFGLRHLLNLIETPDAPLATIAQVLFTFMAGVYLCSLYLSSKNIFILVVIHALEDFSSEIWTLFSTKELMDSAKDMELQNALFLVVIQSIYLIFGILMIKNKKFKYEEISEVKENEKSICVLQ